MSKYEILLNHRIEMMIVQRRHPDFSGNLTEAIVNSGQFNPTTKWGDCYSVMGELQKITGGVFLKEDGSATAEINGKQETATGGHCRAICILYLMAKDSENQLQKS